ncbi:hypothetical protein I4F81_007476 [Pyropia yezoensis]|uniref:Uncharacterized protein n=1 Tax=Pyropia yezoensis TaxID=2788 RepID=A0ACC3C491_PYRYE|nr:hypothetical protein I4F81_007476 [Neopyropia yezoensis]|eukprot:contig_7312_g1713
MAFIPPVAGAGGGGPRRSVGERRPVLPVCGHASQRVRGGGRVGRSAPSPPRMTAAKTSPAQAEAQDVDFLPAQKPTKHDLATGRDPNRVKIFDTTLRDGEQSPGATLTGEEKMIIARQLAKLGVDIIEAGFPIASEGDFHAVHAIAEVVGNRPDPPIVCGLARALKADIDRCWEAIKPAAFPRIHTFIATSDVHMEHKLKKSRAQVLAITTEMVTHARSLCDDVEFSAEDAIRSDPEFLYQVFSAAVAAGATTLNVPDTVGYTTPNEFSRLIRGIRANVVGVEGVTLSVHGHDDLGMAVANFLSAVESGARQMECTINGIGERAGNAALEELVMALHVRRNYYNTRLGRTVGGPPLTNINHTEIYQTSRLVSSLTGMLVQPNKAIVGANAFSHESGIHQDGVLKNPETYEIMDARSVGLKDNSMVLGKLSGRHAFRSRLTELGYELTDEEVNRAFVRFKELADTKKTVSSWDIESIVNDEVRAVDAPRVALHRVQVSCGNLCVPTSTVSLSVVNGAGGDAAAAGDEPSAEVTTSATGTGPVDATFKAINSAVGELVDVALEEYTVSAVTKGIDALGEVTVRVRDGATGRRYTGNSSDTDVVVASAQAYIRAINRCTIAHEAPEPIHPQVFGAL